MNASGAGRNGWVPTNSANLYGSDGGVCVCVCVLVCARAHAYVRMRTCVMCLQYTIKYLTQAEKK